MGIQNNQHSSLIGFELAWIVADSELMSGLQLLDLNIDN